MTGESLGRLLMLEDANTRVVLAGASILGLAAGVVGAITMLRRRALVGDAISHASLPGICLAYMFVGSKSFFALLVGALVLGLISVWCVTAVRAWTRVKEDAAIAIVIGAFFGLGVALSGIIQKRGGEASGLDGFILGKAATMIRADVLTISAVCVAVLAIVAVLLKEFRLLCFDRDFGVAIGRPIRGMDLLLMVMVCLVTVAGLPAVGVVMIVALLVIPAASARLWTDRFGRVVLLSGVIGLFAGAAGTALSAILPSPPGSQSRGWPTGPLIVIAAGAIFLASALLAPRRGVLARWRESLATRRLYARGATPGVLGGGSP